MRVDELETPVLAADLAAVERNVAGMQAYCGERARWSTFSRPRHAASSPETADVACTHLDRSRCYVDKVTFVVEG